MSFVYENFFCNWPLRFWAFYMYQSGFDWTETSPIQIKSMFFTLGGNRWNMWDVTCENLKKKKSGVKWQEMLVRLLLSVLQLESLPYMEQQHPGLFYLIPLYCSFISVLVQFQLKTVYCSFNWKQSNFNIFWNIFKNLQNLIKS